MQNQQKNYKQSYLNQKKFADLYILDIPAVLRSELVEHFTPVYGKEDAEIYYSFLYTVYSMPNIVLPLYGGVLSDLIGYRKMTIIFLLFITIGQIIITCGINVKSLKIMILGRFIFGIGGESLGISINSLIVNWFQGNEVSFAQSIKLSIIRFASVLNSQLTPRISEHKSITYSFYFGIFICLFSLLCAIILVYVDYKLTLNPIIKQQKQYILSKQLKLVFVKIFKNIKKMSKLFWILTFLTIALYICVVTFNTCSSSILIDLWLPKTNLLMVNQELAGQLMGIPYIIASLLFPLFGYICDKFGQRINLLIISTILCFTSFALFPFVQPKITLSILGFSYAIFGAVIWPTVSYIIPKNKLGVGYGIMGSLQNIISGSMPLVITFIQIQGNSISVVYFFIIISLVSIILVIQLYQADCQQIGNKNFKYIKIYNQQKNIHYFYKKYIKQLTNIFKYILIKQKCIFIQYYIKNKNYKQYIQQLKKIKI
ncbi:major facilitator superfamily protein, putative [Ichthyophthirius multifiliis]|uniref:Lysosomal dipeptide transporter MFSD1 n=1 Tax=Ichthyophthirius multifiliis TaxID=5932 RepID=G0QK13_ICHMU|nr:major facilitator superfamily protein, putative [Ichthyophthirius multifiliis]EGR34440.1 major facilitator superfamily protein, putative [Ichthyophthirius multifiliis]|eukprot:XP_004039744.1 major facilitator superfamily protein, putative [Ichthyophthirius multifiliis]